MGILILIRPYYLFPTHGDLDFHLIRAREIIQNPGYGLYWDYLVYYPQGRALWHPPLFHSVLASLWYLGGIRFAHSVMCMAQVLLSVWAASWFANKKYGIWAGFMAGIFVICCPRPDNLIVLMPATFIPVLALLTIYYLPKDGTKSALATITAIWTHMLGSVLILLFLVTEKGRSYLKNWKILLPLLGSILFWTAYWIYFSGQTGAGNKVAPSLALVTYTNFLGLAFLSIFGILGLYIVYKENRDDFRLFSTYIGTMILIQFLFSDLSRGLQYAALPLAVLASLGVWKTYLHVQKEFKRIKPYFLGTILFLSVIASASFTMPLYNLDFGWEDAGLPFEKEYGPLDIYLKKNVDQNEVIWAQSSIADKVAWSSGYKVANGRYGSPSTFQSIPQNINIYKSDQYFIIKNRANETMQKIKIIS